MENGEISASSSEWKIGLDELFVTWLNCDSKNKLGKPIKTYFDLFIKTSLNHMSIRSRLVSQPNKKLFSNSEKSIKTYLDLFINTGLNHMSIVSRLVSQPKNKLN